MGFFVQPSAGSGASGDAGSMGCVQLVKELSRADDAEREG